MTTQQTIVTLRARGWTIEGPQSDYLDDDLPPPDMDDVKVLGYRVKSPNMRQSYHTAKPMMIASMETLEAWVLTGATFSYGEGNPYPDVRGRPYVN